MSAAKWIVTIIAVGHLGLVALGAAGIEFGKCGVVGRALDRYGAFSGAATGYGFFATGVQGQYRLGYDRVDRAGATERRYLDSFATSEANVRVGNLIDQFYAEHPDPKRLRRSLAASFAANVFSNFPDTQRVTIYLEEFNTVSMAQYRAGERPEWHPYYDATFEHRVSAGVRR